MSVTETKIPTATQPIDHPIDGNLTIPASSGIPDNPGLSGIPDSAGVNNRPDEDFSFGVVPTSSRRSFWAVGFVMLGFTFFSASMSVGAKLGIGLDLGGFVAAVSIGGAILATLTGAPAFGGAETGMGGGEPAPPSFGRFGSF
ncbi:cytosine permease, partial [Actinotignum timonense]|nr:cytosine permease [Actinotignum timonense]